MPGHSYLEAGDVIKFNLISQEPKEKKLMSSGKTNDEYHSGRYIITKLRHQVVKQGYVMVLECVKDSVATRYSDEDKFVGVVCVVFWLYFLCIHYCFQIFHQFLD